MLRKMMIVAAAVAALSVGLVATEGFARGGGGGGHGGFGATRGMGRAQEQLLIKPATPQLNNPGPQHALPQPGNPVQQLSPLGTAGQPDSLGIR